MTPNDPKGPTAPLDEYIRTRMAEAHLPGMAVGLVRDGALQWSRGYGWADVDLKEPVTPDTLFRVASISEIAAAATILKTVEDGGLDLDTPISAYLPFEVVHPRFPRQPITLRMLLAHTSGICDNADITEGLYVQTESGPTLRKFLADYLCTGGKYYDDSLNFTDASPGKAFELSSAGLSLAAFAVECVAGQPFDGFCRRNVFEMLGMNRARWRLTPAEIRSAARPYRYHKFAGTFESYGHYWTPNYPDSGLYCSVGEVWRLFTTFTELTIPGVPRVLQPESARLMTMEHFPEAAPGMGLGCFHETRNHTTLVGHAGADHGVAARMFWRPDCKTGVVIAANGEPTNKARWALIAIENRLFEAADALIEAEQRAGEEPVLQVSTVVPFPKRHAS